LDDILLEKKGGTLMRKLLSGMILVVFIMLTGCAGLYSQQDFGPTSISGSNLQEVIQQNGPPDVVGGNDQYMVMTWYHTDGLQVLGLFSLANKKALGVAIDKNGKVVSQGSGKEGQSLTILGPMPAPVSIVETK